MLKYLPKSTDLRLLLPEIIWLEPEHFQQAKEISAQVNLEAQQWQIYLNALALIGFEEWLNERIPEQPVSKENCSLLQPQINPANEAVCNLKVGEFKFSLIATENLLDEVVKIPQNAVDNAELAAHFYVVCEVLEEQEQVIIRGFLRYDQLVNYRNNVNAPILQNGYYQLPHEIFDAEPNHLVFYSRFLEPSAIPLPVVSDERSQNLLESLQTTRTQLSQWLQDIFEEGWQALESLMSPEANLALSIRNTDEGIKRAKLINLGMQLGSQIVALLVNITSENQDKLTVLVQLHPTGGERYLLPNINLTLLSKTGKILQEVQARSQDNYIQLKPFKGEPGKCFSIAVSLEGISVTENFEL